MIPRHREAALLRARRQRIALRAGRTLAHGQMAFRLAHSAHAALTDARIHARVIDAGPMVAALAVALAFASHAMRQRIAGVAGETRAHRALLVRVIVAGLALSVRAARIRRAKVLCWV